MNELIVFNNEEFGEIRTITIDGEPWFVGKDVATALGCKDPSDAIEKYIDDEDKLTEQIVLSGQTREVVLINEFGLYSLIFSSKLPNAKSFKYWVATDILPAIRKTSGYIISDFSTEYQKNHDVVFALAEELLKLREEG